MVGRIAVFFIIYLLIVMPAYSNQWPQPGALSTLENVAKRQGVVFQYCRISKPYEIFISYDSNTKQARFAGRLDKGSYIIPLKHGSHAISGISIKWLDVLLYNKKGRRNEVVRVLRSVSGMGKVQEIFPQKYFGKHGCYYGMAASTAVRYADDILRNDGYLKRAGEKMIARKSFKYQAEWRKTPALGRSYRATNTLPRGGEFSLIHSGDGHNYSLVKVKQGEKRYLSWISTLRYLPVDTWKKNAAVVKKTITAHLGVWSSGTMLFFIVALGLLTLPNASGIVGSAIEQLVGLLQRYWILVVLSGGFFISHFYYLGGIREWDHGDNPDFSPSVWRGVLGLPFVLVLPIAVYLAYLSLAIMMTSRRARKVVQRSIPTHLKEDADYSKLLQKVSGDRPGEKGTSGSFWEKIRVDAMTKELKSKTVAYEELIAMARRREHARDEEVKK